ncbi:unnamed protein product [Urochloa decumbens]|uniref:Uncharacterized protein n=1 Tax=Urochloa decumbens TaxID=240449 RepID=A0ABC8VQG8_9POAL
MDRSNRRFFFSRENPRAESPLLLCQGVAEALLLWLGVRGGGGSAPHLGHVVGEVARRELQRRRPVVHPAEEVGVREQLLAAGDEVGQEHVVVQRRPRAAVHRGGRHGRELRLLPALRGVEAHQPLRRVRCGGEARVAAGAGHGRGGGRERRRRRRRRGGRGEGGHGLLLELGVPVVLDVVVGPAGELGRDDGPPAPDGGVEGPDDPVLLLRVPAVLDVGAQVVEPPQAAALAAPVQPWMAITRMLVASVFAPNNCHSSSCLVCRGDDRNWRPTCFLRQGDPVAADAVALDVAPQLLVLLRRPGPPLHARLVAARRAPHVQAKRRARTGGSRGAKQERSTRHTRGCSL